MSVTNGRKEKDLGNPCVLYWMVDFYYLLDLVRLQRLFCNDYDPSSELKRYPEFVLLAA